MLAAAWFIARKDIAFALRERETWLWVFVMPFPFFYFIGTVTGGFGTGMKGERKDPIAVAIPADAGFLAERLTRRLEEQGYAVHAADSEEGAGLERRIDLPAGFTEHVRAGEQVTVRLVHESEGPAEIFHTLRTGRAVYTTLADVLAAKELSPEGLAAVDSAPRALTLSVSSAGKRERVPRGFEQTVPGTMIMFTLLVLLTSGAIPLLVERREGILRRLASAPLSRGSIVLGKWGGKLALALVQIGFALLAGRLAFRVDWGPSLAMVCVVLFAWAAFNASLAILVGSMARTEGQAVAIGVLSANVLAALGGCWWPIEVTPEWMQRLALFLPTGWAMHAMHGLVSFGRDASSAVPNVLALLAGALIAGWIATRKFRFQ
jgi:ABC-type Na+ efflux pump permease subunit